MNKAILIGRLTKDPELKYTASNGTAVTTFTLAVDRNFKNKDGEKEADFINIVVWNKLAEIVANNLTKGRLTAVSGRIQTRSYETNDGQKRYVTEVIAEDVQFLDKKGSTGAGEAPNSPSNNNNVGNNDDIPGYGENDDDFFPLDADSEIPF